MDEHRVQRVAETLREELSEIVAFELEDPRLEGVTVNEVHLSPDKRTACVMLSIPGGDENQKRALAAIQHAKSFIKKELSHRLDLFRMPDLRFEADLSPALADRMGHLFKRIRKGRPRGPKSVEKSEKSP
jgi:ribosome-binding factor A